MFKQGKKYQKGGVPDMRKGINTPKPINDSGNPLAKKINPMPLGETKFLEQWSNGAGKPVPNPHTPNIPYTFGPGNPMHERMGFYDNKEDNINRVDYNWNDNINLSSGKFKGAKVPKMMINDLVGAAKSQGLDPYQMLALAGQESTFGKGYNVVEGLSGYQGGSEAKRLIVSGWNVSRDSKTMETNSPDDAFTGAAKWIKNKGVQSYNPGSKTYVNEFNNSMDLLKSDTALTNYVSKLKKGGRISGGKKQEGGELVDAFLDELKKGGWIKGAVDPKHKGFCTPMTKSTCTPRRKAFAKRAKAHFK